MFRNSILCCDCKHWIHKKFTNITGRLVEDPSFKCKHCLGLLPVVAIPNPISWEFDGEQFEIVTSFCYLGDVTGERVTGYWLRCNNGQNKSSLGKYQRAPPNLHLPRHLSKQSWPRILCLRSQRPPAR